MGSDSWTWSSIINAMDIILHHNFWNPVEVLGRDSGYNTLHVRNIEEKKAVSAIERLCTLVADLLACAEKSGGRLIVPTFDRDL